MSADIANSDVTSDASPTLPREVQPVFHENDLNSTTAEIAYNRQYNVTSNHTEDTIEHSDRQSQNNPTDAFGGNKERSKLPPKPPDDWQFNHLLLEISKYVSEDLLEEFKSLFRGHGEGSIGKKRLQECRTCMQFFTLLRENVYLSKDNTLYLQKFLYLLGNRDLIKKTIQYCQKEGNLYFYKDEEEPVQGSTTVMFHVKGKHLKDFTPEYVREVRDTVAAILCVPHEHVLIAGLKPSDSFLILLIIPDVYAEIFQQMLIEKEEMFPLTKKNIDYIEIKNNVYYIMELKEKEYTARAFPEMKEQISSTEQTRSDNAAVTRVFIEKESLIEEVRESLKQLQNRLSDQLTLRDKNIIYMMTANLPERHIIIDGLEQLKRWSENQNNMEEIPWFTKAAITRLVNKFESLNCSCKQLADVLHMDLSALQIDGFLKLDETLCKTLLVHWSQQTETVKAADVMNSLEELDSRFDKQTKTKYVDKTTLKERELHADAIKHSSAVRLPTKTCDTTDSLTMAYLATILQTTTDTLAMLHNIYEK